MAGVRIIQGWRALRGDLPAAQKAKMIATFATARPQVLASESVGRVLTLEQTGWTDEQKTIFRDTCAAEMELWGYTFDERYRVAPAG